MYLINKEIATYIRCIKTLWNEFYRALPDGEHDFTDLDRLVWATLVVKLLQAEFESVLDGQIIVKPKVPPSSLLVAVESSADQAVTWENRSVSCDDPFLIFEAFFDFRNWEDPRKLEYIECKYPTRPRQRLLIPTDSVDFYYRERVA